MDKDVKDRRKAPLQTPTDLGINASRDITAALNTLLADVFALYFVMGCLREAGGADEVEVVEEICVENRGTW